MLSCQYTLVNLQLVSSRFRTPRISDNTLIKKLLASFTGQPPMQPCDHAIKAFIRKISHSKFSADIHINFANRIRRHYISPIP